MAIECKLWLNSDTSFGSQGFLAVPRVGEVITMQDGADEAQTIGYDIVEVVHHVLPDGPAAIHLMVRPRGVD